MSVGFVRARQPGPVHIAAVEAPWGDIHVATTPEAVVGLAVHAPLDPFVDEVVRRTGRERERGGRNDLLDRAVAAIEALLEGDAGPVADLPVDLVDRSAWDHEVLGGVRSIPAGEVTSYGRLATRIGRRGAARAVGGAVGRNPVGLVVPCHRVIAGDGTIGGYGGDWFGGREAHLAIKRELLALEGVTLPVRLPRF